jgi:hypothetical protein
MSEKIEKAEAVVRDFLRERMKTWQVLPFDWLDVPPEILDEWKLLPVPMDVLEAYEETRTSWEAWYNYQRDYGLDASINESVLAFLDRMHPDQLDLFAPKFVIALVVLNDDVECEGSPTIH